MLNALVAAYHGPTEAQRSTELDPQTPNKLTDKQKLVYMQLCLAANKHN